MALLGNYSLASKSPGRFFGGNSTSVASGIGQFLPQLPGNWGGTGARRNFALAEGSTNALELTSIPDGYGSTGYLMPVTAGRLSSHSAANGVGAWTGALAEGRNIAASFSGAATFAATGQLVVSGSGSFAGAGSFTGNVIAALAASGATAGVASFSGAVTAKGHMSGSFSASASFTATRYATGSLSGSFAQPITLEASGFSTYLLDEEDIETGLTLRQALRLIAAATGGKVSGGGTTTITFASAVADDVSRITATVDNDGNRTAISYDLD
jgi:hypothetical protein